MKLIHFDDYIHEPTVCTTGNFDGVHTGHRKLLNELNKTAQNTSLKTVVVTFSNHPRSFFHPQQKHQCLTTFEEKTEHLKDFVDFIVAVHFDGHISSMKPEDFMLHLKSHFNMKYYLSGYDHHIGKSSAGYYDEMKLIAENNDFSIKKIGPHFFSGEAVSSTRIKHALSIGNLSSSTKMLGYRYRISGTVIHGRMIGHSIGYPTANIECHCDKVIPARGVYAVKVTFNEKEYIGMLNIGYNPTISSLEKLSIEVHILDFEQDIYDHSLTIELYQRMRDEKAFSSKEELISQLDADKIEIREYFRHI